MMQTWMNVRAITAAAAPMLSAVTRTVALRARVNQAMSATASTAQVHQLSVCPCQQCSTDRPAGRLVLV